MAANPQSSASTPYSSFEPLLYTPDYSFLKYVLDKKTGQYQQGLQAVGSSYSKIKGELTNPENIAWRDTLVKSVDQQLQKVAGSDLSLQQNVNSAQALFQPFWKDDDFLTDYAKTKQSKQQLAIGESFKNSTDKDGAGKYWKDGMIYANLSLQELANAKRGDGSIQRVNVREYVPYIDVAKGISDEMEKMGYKDGIKQSFSRDGYIHTVTNGEGSKQIYNEVASHIINMHPEWKNIFKVQGTNQYYGAVLNERNRTGADETTARMAVGANYQQTELDKVKQNIDKYTVVQGKAETELKTVIASNRKKGEGITKADYDERYRKQQAVDSAAAMVKHYQEYGERFSGKDFVANFAKQGYGEDLFAGSYEDQFVADYAKARASNVQDDVKSDPTVIAAETMENQRKLQEMRNADNQWRDTDGDGYADSKIVQGVDQFGNPVQTVVKTGSKGTLRDASGREITKQESLNMPVADDMTDRRTPEEVRRSAYERFQGSVVEFGETMTRAGAEFVNATSGFMGKYALADYVSMLTDMIHGRPVTITPEKRRYMESTLATLKQDKIITDASIDDWNKKPTLQLQALVTGASNYVNEGSTSKEYSEIQQQRMFQYEMASQSYYHGVQLQNEFEKKVLKNEPKLLDAQIYVPGKGMISESEWVDARIPEKRMKRNLEGQAGMYPTLTPQMVALTPAEKESERKALSKVYRQLTTTANEKLAGFLTGSKDPTAKEIAVNSGGLAFRTDNEGVPETANFIATAAFNDANYTKPLNDDLLKEDAKDEYVDKLVNWLTENGAVNLNNVLDVAKINRSGHGNMASAMFNINMDKLQKLFPITTGPDKEEYIKAMQSISTHGIRTNLALDKFQQFASDDYMSLALENKMVAGGMKASDWTKNNMHYDYTIQRASNGGFMVNMQLKGIKPGVNGGPSEVVWKPVDENIIFPKGYGLTRILRQIHQEGYENSVVINNYYKNQRALTTTGANPYVQLPGESDADYTKRVNEIQTKR